MEEKLKKSIELLKDETAIYDANFCLATSQAIKNVLSELEKLQKENKELKYKYDKALSDLVEADEKNNKLTFEDIMKNINKPVWDYERKRWRVVDGYRGFKNEKYVSFSDSVGWIEFKKINLYKEEK